MIDSYRYFAGSPSFANIGVISDVIPCNFTSNCRPHDYLQLSMSGIRTKDYALFQKDYIKVIHIQPNCEQYVVNQTLNYLSLMTSICRYGTNTSIKSGVLKLSYAIYNQYIGDTDNIEINDLELVSNVTDYCNQLDSSSTSPLTSLSNQNILFTVNYPLSGTWYIRMFIYLYTPFESDRFLFNKVDFEISKNRMLILKNPSLHLLQCSKLVVGDFNGNNSNRAYDAWMAVCHKNLENVNNSIRKSKKYTRESRYLEGIGEEVDGNVYDDVEIDLKAEFHMCTNSRTGYVDAINTTTIYQTCVYNSSQCKIVYSDTDNSTSYDCGGVTPVNISNTSALVRDISNCRVELSELRTISYNSVSNEKYQFYSDKVLLMTYWNESLDSNISFIANTSLFTMNKTIAHYRWSHPESYVLFTSSPSNLRFNILGGIMKLRLVTSFPALQSIPNKPTSDDDTIRMIMELIHSFDFVVSVRIGAYAVNYMMSSYDNLIDHTYTADDEEISDDNNTIYFESTKTTRKPNMRIPNQYILYTNQASSKQLVSESSIYNSMHGQGNHFSDGSTFLWKQYFPTLPAFSSSSEETPQLSFRVSSVKAPRLEDSRKYSINDIKYGIDQDMVDLIFSKIAVSLQVSFQLCEDDDSYCVHGDCVSREGDIVVMYCSCRYWNYG